MQLIAHRVHSLLKQLNPDQVEVEIRLAEMPEKSDEPESEC